MEKVFTLFICFFTLSLYAQQTPQSSLYNFNVYEFNPAIAGIDGRLNINGDIRTQWTGIVGAPVTQSINGHLPVYFTRGGFGLSIRNMTAGVSQNIQASLSYNQIIQIGEQMKISVGLSGGLMQHSFRGTEIRTVGGEYELPGISHNDQQLSETDVNGSAPTFGAGILFEYDKLRIGLSADNLLESELDLSNSQKDVIFNQVRHYFGYITYQIDLSNEVTLNPSLFFKAVSAELQTDVNVSAEFKEKFMLGVSYRGYSSLSTDAMIFQGGFRLNNKLVLRYAYDFGLSDLKSAHSGSHEIMINYDIDSNLGKGTLPQIIYNPRFL